MILHIIVSSLLNVIFSPDCECCVLYVTSGENASFVFQV